MPSVGAKDDVHVIMRDMFARVALRLKGKHPIKTPLEHIMIRTQQDDKLSPEQAVETLKVLLEKAGYSGCPWVMTQHVKDGHAHYHIAVLRVDDTGKLINPKIRPICREVALDQSEKFGLKAAQTMARFETSKRKIAKVWDATASMSPRARLKAFIKAGFVPARGDKGQFVFVDKDGKPHSPHRIQAVRDAKMSREAVSAAFGFDKDTIKNLPTIKAVSKAIFEQEWKPTLNRIARRINNVSRQIRYARYARYNPPRTCELLSAMRSRDAIQEQRELSAVVLVGARGDAVRDNNGVQSVRGTGAVVSGVDAVLTHWQGMVSHWGNRLMVLMAAIPRDEAAITAAQASLAEAQAEVEKQLRYLAEKAKEKDRGKKSPTVRP